MSGKLAPVWAEVEKMLENGLSLIPVRDRDEAKNGKTYFRKTPYKEWMVYKSTKMTREELFHKMSEKDTTAVAIVCGLISGNMEVIDVDVKYKPGIDGSLFAAIHKIMPDLWNRLRIHKTPSGGYHLIYRVYTVPVAGNQKLASRPATDQEIAASVNKKSQPKAFIETRGEAGYVLAPPSLDYSVYIDNPIPIITPEERESLLAICRSFNEILKIDKPYVATKADDSYYDVNPFADFNNSTAAEEVLLQNGWRHDGSDDERVFFTRPGADKVGGISAAFLKRKRYYYIFTTGSDLENDRCYQPSTVLAILQFGGDKKKTYHWLVANGYGKMKAGKEAAIVKSKAMARKPLPLNASPDAVAEYSRITTVLQAVHPYGIFWEVDDKQIIHIHRERLCIAAQGLGFRSYGDTVVQVIGYLIHKRTNREFFDTMKSYIQEEDGDLHLDILNSYESFIQRSGSFTAGRLALLDSSRIMKDNVSYSFKFYSNAFVAIGTDSVHVCDYDSLDGLIWADLVRDREYRHDNTGGKYLEFLRLAVRFDENADYIMKLIGYLAHEYKNEATAYIPVLVEECPDPKQGGGSGKNLFCSLFGLCTSIKNIPGAQTRLDEKFLQSWNGERILSISDVPKDFNYLFLKEPSSGSAIVKKLFKDEVSAAVTDLPKFIIQSNYSFENADGGLKRRIRPLEFTNFFTLSGGVDVHFGGMFPSSASNGDWTDSDFHAFDTFIHLCIQRWITGGLKIGNKDLSSGGWQKQFDQQYGELTRIFIEEHIEHFLRIRSVSSSDFNIFYDRYCNDNAINPRYKAGPKLMNSALTAFCDHNGIAFNPAEQGRFLGVVTKSRAFERKKVTN